MSTEVLNHRLVEVEKDVAEMRAENKAQEVRIRALEIGHARILGWAAGGAFVGGAIISALVKLVS